MTYKWGYFRICVMVITILVALYIYKVADDYSSENAAVYSCELTLNYIWKEIINFKHKHNGQFPSSLEALVNDSDLRRIDARCPCKRLPDGSSSYIYRGSDLSLEPNENMIVLYDMSENHGSYGRNVLYVNGEITLIKEEQMHDIISKDNELRLEIGLPEKPLGQ